MIDPVTGAALTDALAGITFGTLTPAQAYEQGKTGTFKNNLDDIEIGYHNVESNQPSIHGNRDGTGNVVDSTKSEAIDAFREDAGKVDPTTGGSILGSDVGTYNYCVGADSNNEPVALAPVAVDVPKAYQAIGQLLGVSMDLENIDPVFAGKMRQALINAGVLYQIAETGVEKVMGWLDENGVINFAKEGISGLFTLFSTEGVGGDSYDLCQDPDTGRSFFMAPQAFGQIEYNYYGQVGQNIHFIGAWEVIDAVGCDAFLWSEAGENWVYAIGTDPDISFKVRSRNTTTGIDSDTRLQPSQNTHSLEYEGTTYYWCKCRLFNPFYNGSIYTQYIGTLGSNPPICIEDPPLSIATESNYPAQIRAFAEAYAPSGYYPEGTAEAETFPYTPSTAPSGPDVLTEDDPIPTVPVHVPEEDSTIGSTTPPTDPSDDEETTTTPPIPLPIPDTRPSNPEIPLGNVSVVDSTLVDALVEQLADTLQPMPPQSDGIIPLPFMPGDPIDPTDPSGGSTWTSEVPTGGSGLIHVYNPTQAQLIAFGHWLWVTYQDATIQKIWNNPFDGVIGAFELYADAPEGAVEAIRSGFLVSTASAALVQQRYIEIDCGTIVVPEFYGNYLDYSPYSQCYLYLPFIGINEVSIDDIVGHAVNIRYRVDCYNGSCIAMVYVAKEGYQNLCYQFAGNCSVEIPMAGGSQAAIKAGMMQAEAYANAALTSGMANGIASIGNGLMSDNPLGAVGGLISGAAQMYGGYASAQAGMQAARVANKSSVQHSGSFGASHGAMGLKIPHIMIRNPIQVKVPNYNEEYGFPAHKRVIIGACHGYLRVREVHVLSAKATDTEKAAIETILKEGVYIE